MLTKRLEKIVQAIPQCTSLADVGCDHGYIGLSALTLGKADNVVFVDGSQPSLHKAKQNCPQNFESKVRFVCQDGLQSLNVDCAVIAGMGGLEILSILNNADVLPQKLVLQPMRNQQEVRKFLCKHYNITCDYTFFDGKFYDLVVAEKCPTGCVLTEDEIQLGKSNLATPCADFALFLAKEQAKLQQILQQCNDSNVQHKLQRVSAVLAKIQEELQ